MINAKEAVELYEKSLPDELIEHSKLEKLDVIIKQSCFENRRFSLIDANYLNLNTQNYLCVIGFTLMFTKDENKNRLLRISW